MGRRRVGGQVDGFGLIWGSLWAEVMVIRVGLGLSL